MLVEPIEKRAIAFFDGQNLYHAAKRAFGYLQPNYDVRKLAQAICIVGGWKLSGIRFYTAIHTRHKNLPLHHFWTNKLFAMEQQGIIPFRRFLRYRDKEINFPDGTNRILRDVPEEKGIDVRIALDVVLMAIEKKYDVGVLFCQDQDFIEVAQEIRLLSRQQNRWIRLACAYPENQAGLKVRRRGINNTQWISITREMYDACLDCQNYWPKRRHY